MVRNLRSRGPTLALAVGAVVLVAAVVGIVVVGHRSSNTATIQPTTVTQPSHPVSYSSQVVLPLASVKNPAAVAVDATGNLYVADATGNQVVRLAAGAGAPTALPVGGLDDPDGVAVDSGGNLYVTEYRDNQVLK